MPKDNDDFETEFDPFETGVEDTTDEGAETEEVNEPEDEVEDTNEEQGEESDEEEVTDPKAEKMIPESRLKAAINDVNSKLEKVTQENAELRARFVPAEEVPDAQSQPDEYAAHIRLKTSRSIMASTHEDYEDKIAHYQEMAKVNPALNEMVRNHEMPAKLAYDLATRDLEIKELSKLKDDPEYKEFKEWKKQRATTKATGTETLSLAQKLPKNLNRATSVNRTRINRQEDEDDYLWNDKK